MKKLIAYYKVCILRSNSYLQFYYSITLTILVFKALHIPFKFLPLGIIGLVIAILIVGTLDLKLGIFSREQKIMHEESPVLMEILNKLNERKKSA